MKTTFLFLLLLLLYTGLSAQRNPCNSDIANFDYRSAPADTTIILQNGTTLTFNRCEFFDIKDCAMFKEVRNLTDITQSGFSTQDKDGNVLLTSGMVVINFNAEEGCGKSCLTVPVRVRIPMLISTCASASSLNRLYRVLPGGRWELMPNAVREFTDASGRRFFEFFTTCGGAYNCDKLYPKIKVKFKAKHLKNLSIAVTSGCPPSNLNYSYKNRKNIVRAKLFCLHADSINVQVTGTNKNGERINFTKPLSSFGTNYKPAGCPMVSPKIMRKVFGIFTYRERRIYRKYIIK